MTDANLAHKVARSTLWVIASYALTNILYFLRSIILARLLNPLDFGLMGIARMVINMLNIFSEVGIEKALVQKKDIDESILNSAWIVTAIRGVILFILLYVFSPLISVFYRNIHLNPILKLISLSFLFNGITSVGVFLFIKELNFKNKVIFEQANAISNTLVSVVLAIIFKNVWALVIGHLVGTMVGFILSYKLYPFRPSLNLDLKAIKGFFHFGKYVFGSGIIIFIFTQGPDALVGKALGLDSLGFYVLAFGIANTPATSITHVVSQIAFPAYAKLQDDLAKLREGYLKIIRLIIFLSAPIAGGIFMLIPEFVQIFLGIKWNPIVVPVRILCILGFFRSFGAAAGPLFYGIGRPDIEFKLGILNLALLSIFIYPLTIKMGIIGTAITFSLVTTISIFIMIGVIYRLIRLDAERPQFLKILFFPLAATAIMCLSIFWLKLIFAYRLIMTFALSILIGGGLYILVIYVFDKYFGYGLSDTIRFAVNSFRR